jgi:hypothetical protein
VTVWKELGRGCCAASRAPSPASRSVHCRSPLVLESAKAQTCDPLVGFCSLPAGSYRRSGRGYGIARCAKRLLNTFTSTRRHFSSASDVVLVALVCVACGSHEALPQATPAETIPPSEPIVSWGIDPEVSTRYEYPVLGSSARRPIQLELEASTVSDAPESQISSPSGFALDGAGRM